MGQVIKNAKVSHVDITIERGFALVLNLHLDYGDSSGQCFGQHVLHNTEKPWIDYPNFAGYYIAEVLRILESDSLFECKGKPVRVMLESEHGGIKAIGHWGRDDWFVPADTVKLIKEGVNHG